VLCWGVAPRHPPVIEQSWSVCQRTILVISSSRPLSFPSELLLFSWGGVAGYNELRRRTDNQDFNEQGSHPLTRCLQSLSDTDFDPRDFPLKTKGSGDFFSRNFFSVPRPSGGVNFLTPKGPQEKSRRVHWSGKSEYLPLYRERSGNVQGMCPD